MLAVLSNAAPALSSEAQENDSLRLEEMARRLIEDAECAIWGGQTIDDAVQALEEQIDALSCSLGGDRAAQLRRALIAQLNS